MAEEKASYYAIIPSDVRYCNELPANAKLLYGEITALCNKEGYCWASNKYFADLYDVSTASISSWIKALRENEFIRCDIESNYRRKIFLVVDRGIKKTCRGYQENLKGVSRKLEYNNTINNISNNTKKEEEEEEEKQKTEIKSEKKNSEKIYSKKELAVVSEKRELSIIRLALLFRDIVNPNVNADSPKLHCLIEQALQEFEEIYSNKAEHNFEQAMKNIMKDNYWVKGKKGFEQNPTKLSPSVFLNPKWVKSTLIGCVAPQLGAKVKQNKFANDPDVKLVHQHNQEALEKLMANS